MPVKYCVLCFLMAARLSLFAAAALSINPGALPKIEANGSAGDLVSIEAAFDLTGSWDMLGSLVLTNDSVQWNDLWAGSSSQRFYRITRSAPSELPLADDFRLIDHLGKSQRLFYLANAPEIKAFVLVFTANGCDLIKQEIPAIQALRQKFESQGVVFWMIDSNPTDTRTSIAAEAKKLGITSPILQDAAQTVAHLYKVETAGEVVLLDRESLGIVYRGALDERNSAGDISRNYLDEALTALVAGKPYNIRQTKSPGCSVPLTPIGDVSYSRDIAPILQAKCVSCHSPGAIAPWAMTSYATVKDYARSMVENISAHEMPPWHADPEYGHFKNDISLSLAQEQKLIAWLMAGAPRGDGPDPLENVPPPPPKWPVELGEPDLIIRAPEQHIRADGIEPYRYIFVDTGLKEDVWLRAAVVRPSNRSVVHHYIVWEGASSFQMAAGLAGYVPGTDRGIFPEGSGVILHGDTQVTFNLHYTPNGEDAVDQPELALWFHKTPPPKELITLPWLNTGFTIPAGAREYEVTAVLLQSLPYAGTLYSMSPHMHVRGKRMKFEVVYPDNRRETLLSVPNYEFHWQTTYQLVEPKKIPAKSKLIVTGAFDNSTLNEENPDPTRPVKWGEQSFEEMFIGYFEFTQD
jgi:hypothetical protein